MSNEIKTKEDPTYESLGYDPYLSRSLSNKQVYQTTEDFNFQTEDGIINNAKISNFSADKITAGKIQSNDTKTYFDLDGDVLIVNDGTNDRVLIGYQSGGF